MLPLEKRLLQDSNFFNEGVEELIVEIFLSNEIHSTREFSRIKSSIKGFNERTLIPNSFYDYLIQIFPQDSKNPIVEYITQNPNFFRDEILQENDRINYPQVISNLRYIPNKVLHRVFTRIRELLEDKEGLEDLISRYKEEKEEDFNTFKALNRRSTGVLDEELFKLLYKTTQETCEFTLFYLEMIDDSSRDVKELFSRISPVVGSYVEVQQLFGIQTNTYLRNSSVQKKSPLYGCSIELLTNSLVHTPENQRESLRRRLEDTLFSHTFSSEVDYEKLSFKLTSILFPQLDIENYIFDKNPKFSKTKKFELCGMLNLIRKRFENSNINDIGYKTAINDALKTASSCVIRDEPRRLLLTYNP